MALIVQKFGGTSVGNIDSIRRVAQKISETRQQGYDLVIVVSAMAGETNRLISLAESITMQPDLREYARLLASGEQAASALLAIALITQGHAARSYTGEQIRLRTNGPYDKARIIGMTADNILADLQRGVIPIIAGFQGVSAEGEITLLGRGGSDTTAAAVAAILNADECQIYTDVDGIYTADPNLLQEVQRLNTISSPLLLEFAHAGAKVVQHRAVAIAHKHQIPLRILSSFDSDTGTQVNTSTTELEQAIISGISCEQSIARILITNIAKLTDFLTRLLCLLNQSSIEIDMLAVQTNAMGKHDLNFVLNHDDCANALAIVINLIEKESDAAVRVEEHLAKLSVLGVGVRSDYSVITTIMQSLQEHIIEVLAVTCSELRISVIIQANQAAHSVRVLHDVCGLTAKTL